MYTVQIRMTKTFTRGALVGMTIKDTLRQVDRKHAEMWLRGVQRNIRAGALDYRLDAYTIEPL